VNLLPARGDLALCSMSQHCPAKDRCYRSPTVRAIAIGAAQNWMETTPRNDGPCSEFWAEGGEALYITADQVDSHRAAGWTVEPFTHHHGAQGYHLATREVTS